MKVETPIALPNGRYTKTSGETFPKLGLVIHQSLQGKSWCITSPRSGLLVVKAETKKACFKAFQKLTERLSESQILESINAAPAAPPLDSIKPHQTKIHQQQ